VNFRDELVSHQPYLIRFALKLTMNSDRALDLVQDTFLRCMEKEHQYQPGTNLRGWAGMVLRNIYFGQYRVRNRLTHDADGKLTAAMIVPPAQHGVMDIIDFMDALAQIPKDMQETLYLVAILGHTMQEAADILEIAEGTVKSRVSRARKALRSVLKISGSEAYGPDPIMVGVASGLDHMINNPQYQVH